MRASDLEYGRRRLRNVIFALCVIAVVGFVLNWYLGRRALGRTGSRVISASKPFTFRRAPVTYYASYLVDTRAGDSRVLTRERTWVRRPFDSRIETWSGNKRLSVRQSAFGALANENPTSEPLSISVPPNLASGDLRVDAAVPEAVHRHLIIRRERRIVYGRECQVYRAGGPISAGDITAYQKDSTEYADFCIDRRGLIVEEVWFKDGKLLRRRVATTVKVGPKLSDKLFAITITKQTGIDKGSMEPLTGRDLNRALWVLPSAPSGFHYKGRYGVILPTSATTGPSGVPAPPTASITDVYTDRGDLLVVDQDASLASATASENRSTIPVKVKGFAHAVLVVDGRSSEVRAETPDGSYIRVFGTLPAGRLIELAGRLQLVRG